MRELIVVVSCFALASCGNGPTANDRVVELTDLGNAEFNCTKQRVRIYKNNDGGVKEGWYTLPEMRKALVAESMSPFIVEFQLKNLRESADSYCDN